MSKKETKRQLQLTVTTARGLHDITDSVRDFVSDAATTDNFGVNVFCPHTSCSLLLNENCDNDVTKDLENWLSHLVKEDGSYSYVHSYEGPDDMPAHIKTAVTSSSIIIPIVKGKVALGTWQGLFLWEHRDRPHARKIILTLLN